MTRISVSQIDDWDSVEDHDEGDWEVPEVDVLQRADQQLPRLMEIVDGESAARLIHLLQRDRASMPVAAESRAGAVDTAPEPRAGV